MESSKTIDPPGSHTHGFMRFPVGEHKQVRTREAEEGLQNELPLQRWERRPTPIHMEHKILRYRLPTVGLGLQNLGWNILPCRVYLRRRKWRRPLRVKQMNSLPEKIDACSSARAASRENTTLSLVHSTMRLDKRHFLPPCLRRPRSFTQFTRSQVVIVIAIERREGEGGRGRNRQRVRQNRQTAKSERQ